MELLVGKITKSYKVEKGFKGHITLPNGRVVYLNCPYDGETAEYLKESVDKTVMLIGDLRVPSGKDVKDYTWIFDVRSKSNGGTPFTRLGHLTADPELKYSPKGKAYTKFSIAINYGFGERKQTDFINGTVWGNDKEKNKAINFAENGIKGKQVYIEGLLSQTEKDGKKYTDLTVNNFQFTTPNSQAASSKGSQNNPGEQSWGDIGTEMDEEEIPF